MAWVLVSKSLFSLMLWREACKLKTSTMGKFEYESCQNHLAMGEKDVTFCPDRSSAVSHVCLNSQDDCKDVLRKALAQVGSLYVVSSAALPSLFPFVRRVLRVTGVTASFPIQNKAVALTFLSIPWEGQFENRSGNSTESCTEAVVIHCCGQQWPFPQASCAAQAVLCSLSTDIQK